MLGYGTVGAVGAGVGAFAQKAAGLKSFLTGAGLNVAFEGAIGQFSGEGVNVWGRVAGSAITGGFSALAGKNFGDAFAKGTTIADKKFGHAELTEISDFANMADDPLFQNGVFEAGLKKMKAKKQIFSAYNMGQYSLKAMENVGAKLNANDGHMNLRQFGGYFGAGFLGGLATFSTAKGLTTLGTRRDLFGMTSIVSPLVGYSVGDFTQNTLNYWTKENNIGFSWSKVYNDGLKSVFKIDFFTGATLGGFKRFNNIFSFR
jgi:hypothetical protein